MSFRLLGLCLVEHGACLGHSLVTLALLAPIVLVFDVLGWQVLIHVLEERVLTLIIDPLDRLDILL